MLLQAADAGDAERVGKARKKKKRKAAEEEAFASDNEDVAYEQPEVEDLDAQQQEEPEWDDRLADDGAEERRNRDVLKGTGELLRICLIAVLVLLLAGSI